MKRRSLLFLVVGSIASTTAMGLAFATPGSGVDAVTHVMGADLPGAVKVNADGIKFRTKRATDVSVLTLTVAPGGTTGWHSHPGFAVISVTEGTGTLYYADCSSESFPAGRAFVETGDDPPTKFTNETGDPVVLTVTFFAPQDAPIIQDEAQPDCG
jgi:hypothetical protein